MKDEGQIAVSSTPEEMVRYKLDHNWAEKLATQVSADATLGNILDVEERQRSDVRLRGNIHDIKGTMLVGCGSNFNGRVEQQGRLFVGRYCAFGAGFTSLGGQHRTDVVNLNIRLQNELGFKSNHQRSRPTFIGHNVWGGSNVTLLGGVRVGTGAILGTGDVVTKDIPPFAIAVGVGAKVKGFRFVPQVIEQLLDIAEALLGPLPGVQIDESVQVD